MRTTVCHRDLVSWLASFPSPLHGRLPCPDILVRAKAAERPGGAGDPRWPVSRDAQEARVFASQPDECDARKPLMPFPTEQVLSPSATTQGESAPQSRIRLTKYVHHSMRIFAGPATSLTHCPDPRRLQVLISCPFTTPDPSRFARTVLPNPISSHAKYVTITTYNVSKTRPLCHCRPSPMTSSKAIADPEGPEPTPLLPLYYALLAPRHPRFLGISAFHSIS
ncbi:hypothetical protein LX32DRAFT_165621 [Colletotrichum zoysiae]|uniref:Uncharacterized protein n=1 Tax=Colletotrichum zoysiae TaxID=1216348 RepID=A0AAD9H6B0_9PEZI|nr:hypothetical protein LX32DRAFT_165621 [Colletotrichum zoysiae]